MDARRAALFLATILLAASARAEAQKPQTTSAKLKVLEDQISDPQAFKSYVEGSMRVPEVMLAPQTQAWPQSAGIVPIEQAPKPIRLRPTPDTRTPLVPAEYSRRYVPATPDYAYRSRWTLPTKQDLPKWPLAGFGLTALAVAGLFAFAAKKEFEPHAPIESFTPKLPPAPSIAELTDTPATRTLLAKLDKPIEPFVDTRIPMSMTSWRSISMREQHLLEMWDASYEKAVGQDFGAWLDCQLPLEGAFQEVDAQLLKRKLERAA